ncbi:MAG: hypothetical protein JZD41_08150, partial [Thermoproteus sp.]|nr:hypothetical protein [Thermoproteus sp.]
MAEGHRIALEAVLAGMALKPRLLVDLLEERRGGREIAVEALNALSRAVERAEGRIMPLRERVIEAVKAGDERRLSALARRIIEATPPSLRYLLHDLVEELRAGKTPKEAVEALRPRLAELARDAAEAFKNAEDVEYLAKSFGVRSSSEEEILRAFEESFLRAAERLAKLPEDRRRDVLGYIEKRLGRLLKVVGIAAIGVALAVLANDPSWVKRSIEAIIATAGAHAALPVVIFAIGLAKRVGAEEAAREAENITAAVIKAEVWRRAEKEGWRRFMDVEEAKFVIKGPNLSELVLNNAKIGEI